jgi:hypothetical protein
VKQTTKCAFRLPAGFCLLLLTASAAVADPVVGQIDTFTNGTTQNWFIGPDAPLAARPAAILSGGPAGAGDRFLQLTALGGNGPGSKLSVINSSQWSGNYLAAGVDAITMDLRNFGPSDLFLRLLFVGPLGPTGPSALTFSADAVFLPGGSAWTPVTFRIGPGDLTTSFGSFTEALSSTSELRLFHNPTAAFSGPGGNAAPAVAASLGVDNIRAVAQAAAAAPEPGSLALAAPALLTLALSARRRRGGWRTGSRSRPRPSLQD